MHFPRIRRIGRITIYEDMTKDIFESEFLARCRSKRMALSKEDCPISDEEFATYKEGWIAAWQWAEDILVGMMRETKDITEG